MTMRNPSHPGASLRRCLEDSDLTAADLARELHISRSKLFRVLRGAQNITAELAVRLERLGWSNADFWMRRQANYDLAQARRKLEAA